MRSPRTSGTRVVTRAFEALGNEPAAAQRLAAWSTLAVMLGIEVLDGYSKRYSFSWEDAAMNVVGVGLGYLMERNRDLDNLLDLRLLYKKSGSSFDPAGDYSGQTYLLVAKASGVPALRGNSVLRYFELAAGYGTRGYEEPAWRRTQAQSVLRRFSSTCPKCWRKPFSAGRKSAASRNAGPTCSWSSSRFPERRRSPRTGCSRRAETAPLDIGGPRASAP